MLPAPKPRPAGLCVPGQRRRSLVTQVVFHNVRSHPVQENQWEYYSGIEENEILSFAMMRMELQGIMLSKISQTNSIGFHSCGISEAKQMYIGEEKEK